MIVAGYNPKKNAKDFYYDEEEVRRVLDFFPHYLVHVKGRIAGQPMEPNPWEREFLSTLFGWKRKSDDTRRYREAFVGIPRKNNKSTLAAGLSLYLLMSDREQGAEVYCAASDKDQASLVFNIAASNVRRHKSLSSVVKIKEAERRMVYRGESLLRAIPADAAGSHGFNAHAVIMDELHTQPNRELYDVLKTSMAARRQPLMISITTAGHDKESICYEVWDYARKVRDGVINDPHFLPVLYEAPEKADWKDEKTWQNCNPNFGLSVSSDYLREAFERAKQTPSFENTFKNLHLNLWTESQTRWITSESWDKCESAMPELDGESCYVGLDLGSTSDLTALVYVFPLDEQFVIVPHFFCPEDVIRDAPKKYQSQYREWLSSGLITPTPGSSTDYSFVRKQIFEDAERYQIKEIAFDAWQALDTYNLLDAEGFECIKVSQSFAGMWPGVKALEESILDRDLIHDGNAVLRWMIASTVVDIDANGNKKPNKKKSQGEHGTKGKIDGVVAMCMAMGRAANALRGDSTPYDERGIISL